VNVQLTGRRRDAPETVGGELVRPGVRGPLTRPSWSQPVVQLREPEAASRCATSPGPAMAWSRTAHPQDRELDAAGIASCRNECADEHARRQHQARYRPR
jgi:hypothetical protein